MRGLNGRGWRRGPGPRLSAEHLLGMALLGVGMPKGAGEVAGPRLWGGVKTLTGGLRASASRAPWETPGASPLRSPKLTHARSPPE